MTEKDLLTHIQKSTNLAVMPDTRLKDLRQQRDRIDLLISDEVERMRENDQPWSLIAEALGVTRQAAQQRYGNTTNK